VEHDIAHDRFRIRMRTHESWRDLYPL